MARVKPNYCTLKLLAGILMLRGASPEPMNEILTPLVTALKSEAELVFGLDNVSCQWYKAPHRLAELALHRLVRLAPHRLGHCEVLEVFV